MTITKLSRNDREKVLKQFRNSCEIIQLRNTFTIVQL